MKRAKVFKSAVHFYRLKTTNWIVKRTFYLSETRDNKRSDKQLEGD